MLGCYGVKLGRTTLLLYRVRPMALDRVRFSATTTPIPISQHLKQKANAIVLIFRLGLRRGTSPNRMKTTPGADLLRKSTIP